MSLDKAIRSGKEKRKPYRGSQRFDHSCRPGGSCPWCYRGRKGIKDRRLRLKAKEETSAET